MRRSDGLNRSYTQGPAGVTSVQLLARRVQLERWKAAKHPETDTGPRPEEPRRRAGIGREAPNHQSEGRPGRVSVAHRLADQPGQLRGRLVVVDVRTAARRPLLAGTSRSTAANSRSTSTFPALSLCGRRSCQALKWKMCGTRLPATAASVRRVATTLTRRVVHKRFLACHPPHPTHRGPAAAPATERVGRPWVPLDPGNEVEVGSADGASCQPSLGVGHR